MAEIPVQITLRPYASSLPLACFAFATGNALFSAYLLHWIPATEAHLVALLLLAFAAPLELVPSVVAFLARDTGGATAFAIFGAAWVVQGLELLTNAPTNAASAGVFLLCLALGLLMLAIVTFKGKPLLGAILIVAILRTSCAAASALSGNALTGKLTAGFGLLLALLAFYSGIAFLEEDVTGRNSPLTFRTGEAKAAMDGRLEDQIDAIKHEAGVRKQL